MGLSNTIAKMNRRLRDTSRTCVIFFLIQIVCIAVFLFGTVLRPPPKYEPWIIGTAEPGGELDEILLVTANSGTVFLTQRKYSGTVMLYLRDPNLNVPYTPEGNPFPTPVARPTFSYQDFWIDGNQLTDFSFFMGSIGVSVQEGSPNLPAYHPAYGYRMLYRVGNTLRRIAFQLKSADVTRAKVVEVLVSIENRFCCSGR